MFKRFLFSFVCLLGCVRISFSASDNFELSCTSHTFYSVPASLFVTTVPAVGENITNRYSAHYLLSSTGTSGNVNYVLFRTTMSDVVSTGFPMFSSTTYTFNLDFKTRTTFYFQLPPGSPTNGLTIKNINCFRN